MCHRGLSRHVASIDNCELIGELKILALQLLDEAEQECVMAAKSCRK